VNLTIDPRTEAARPGGVRLNLGQYVKYFPFWPGVFSAALALGAGLVLFRTLHGLWLAVPAAAAFLIYKSHLTAHFSRGCTNPAIVLQSRPLLLAVYSDLSTGSGSYPVIKVLHHPAGGERLAPQTRCATISLYSGSTQSARWEDFTPRLMTAAHSDRRAMIAAMEYIPEEEWSLLERAVADLPKPWKPGLYPILKR